MKSKNITILITVSIVSSFIVSIFIVNQLPKESSEENTANNDLSIPKTSGTDIAICTAAKDQYSPDICSDGLGGVIVVWHDNRSGELEIYAQRINSNGDAEWTHDGEFISDTRKNSMFWLAICSDGVGGAIITWINYTGTDFYIYAQRINSSGSIQWSPQEGVPICTIGSTIPHPRLCSDGNEGAIIIWNDDRADYKLYAQRINSDGNVEWDDNGIPIISHLDMHLGIEHSICSDNQKGAIIIWRNSTGIGGEYTIYAQRVNETGDLQWNAEGIAVCNTPDKRESVFVSKDGFGGALITWKDKRSGDYDIYAQRINSTGHGQWTPNGTLICSADDYQGGSQICSDELGGAYIAWDDARFGTADIYAQRVNSTGDPQWTPNGMRISREENYLNDLSGDGFGGFIIAWVDESYNDRKIYAQHIDSTGTTVWTDNGTSISTVGGYKTSPIISVNETGHVIIVWRDNRNSNWDTYCQIIPTLRNLDLDIACQSFSTEQFNITFSVYNEKDQGIDVANIQMWWNNTDVTVNITNLDDGVYIVYLEPITVAPNDDPIILNMTISSLGYYDIYYETNIAVDPDVIDKEIRITPTIGGNDDDDDDKDIDFGFAVVVVVVSLFVGAGLSVIYILTKKRIIHKPRR